MQDPFVIADRGERRRGVEALAAAACLAVALTPYIYALWNTPELGRLADQPVHLALSDSFVQALRDLEIPPSWSGGINGGRGGPAFVLYPPLFFLLTSACSVVAPEGADALGLALLLSAAWLFAGVYYWARGELSAGLGLFAATCALLLPGASLIGWGRGMLPNFLALGWTAFLFGAGSRALAGRNPRRALAVMSGAAAGLVLTHALSALMAGVLALVCVPVAWKRAGPRALGWGAVAAGAAAATTLWFWAPLAAAAHFAETGALAESHPYAASLWRGPSGGDDGFARAWAELNDLGLMIAAAQLAAAAVIWAVTRGTRSMAGRTLPLVAGWIALASVYPFGSWLAALPGLEHMQFAWRWQGPLALWCAVAAAGAIGRRGRAGRVAPALVALFFLPLFTPVRERRASRPPTRTLTAEAFAEVSPDERAWYTTNLIEMRPEGAPRLRYPPGARPAPEMIEGRGRVEALGGGQARRVYRVKMTDGATIRLPEYAFPGWTATWDGKALAFEAEEGSRRLLVRVPTGEGTLELRFSRWELLRAALQ